MLGLKLNHVSEKGPWYQAVGITMSQIGISLMQYTSIRSSTELKTWPVAPFTNMD